ncbi:MAG: endonuclease MutS2 [Candidatus Cloacimonetes bacterium]|nr:endonuclease MutS2 [Candidatus Cloacimonadota bacterium]MCF7814017.1 endonuclease MutS2 [Candidatus Cloacimonadota bacterium]MCF7868079.1 endonuclease MutS2 [Candidatus Cloacimonadota bacterium]MCF7883502.1 endonuclease MutS2 [Candidatus Cloacimonadota bacterium]
MQVYSQLEYNKIKEILAEECHSGLGRQLALELKPLSSKTEVDKLLVLNEEIRNLIKTGLQFNFSRISNLNELLNNIKHITYNYEEFQQIYFNLEAANNIYYSEENQEDNPKFVNMIQKLFKLPELAERFKQIFDTEGLVKDSASTELANIRKKKRKLRRSITGLLNTKLNEFENKNYIHDKIVTQRDGRFVIPLKESSTSFVQGIVHGRSGSKNSVYMEPQEAVGINNEIDMTSSEEKREIHRIFIEYTKQLREYKTEIIDNTKILQELDFHFAVGRFSHSISAEKPEIVEKPIISLSNARHPLLIHSYGSLKKVIPFDLELGREFKLLLISGPNTGGKTVTLKTIGLLTLMALSGLPIPARFDSKIGIFPQVFADIGDNQSLENALSTFSSHIKNIDEMVKKGTENSLVLIDEIGAATDPEQGSALAQSILEKLAELNCVGVITTHYTALKIFAEKHKNCMNAAMQFDADKHVPTYNFKLGLPGNSFAIEVASRLGMNENLINRAKELTGNQSVEMTDLLTRMTEEKQALSHQLYQYELKTALLNKKIDEHQHKIDEMEENSKAIKRKSMREAREFLTTLQKELNNEIDSIKKSDKKRRKELLENSLNKINEQNLKFKEQEDQLQDFQRELETNPKPGKLIWLKDMETEAEIIEVFDKEIKVDMGGIFFTTSNSNIFKTTKKPVKKTKPSVSVPRPEVKMELKILGNTFDEAKPKIETFIDNAIFSGLERLRIVHGKGTGALRAKVRQYLRKKKKVVDFFSPPPEAGGDGVTVVVLEK